VQPEPAGTLSRRGDYLGEMEQMYGSTLTEVSEKEVVKGTVVGISDRDVILNIGFKSDGLVPLSEFRDLPDLKVGDEVEVFIENQEDATASSSFPARRPRSSRPGRQHPRRPG
jgi:ribosomal protein S1